MTSRQCITTATISIVILAGMALIDMAVGAQFDPVKWLFGAMVAVLLAHTITQAREQRRKD